MDIAQQLASRRPFFSFEFFPPKDDAGREQLFATVASLDALAPAFVSITYGAGGSTRARTVDLAKQIAERTGITVLAHVTAYGQSRTELRSLFDELSRSGIKNVLALRGDPPRNGGTEVGEFPYARDLVAFLERSYDFCIGAACYPETHIEAVSPEADLAHLVAKVAAGARFLITQLFFDNEKYFSFVERARAAGISVPILPGIMPITNYDQIARFTKMCGASFPPKLVAELEKQREHPKAIEDLGVAYAAVQAMELLRGGAPGVHFYTLNRSPAARAIGSALLAASAWRPVFS
ncbi:MAG TPA: methylenetetrahydrofolate reductase [NAD(P)H] [Candidatus Dormibacteraeota bacterium]|nr:methylenetetrahydrofolate reductase [NAD(P)H] [Candidatus Dormibacteraeota bacterium]